MLALWLSFTIRKAFRSVGFSVSHVGALRLAGFRHNNSLLRHVAAFACLAAILTLAGVQAVHMHPDAATAPVGSMDSHCSLCMVSHCVLRPQHSFAFTLPARVVLQLAAAYAPQRSHSAIFQMYVRPPPAA